MFFQVTLEVEGALEREAFVEADQIDLVLEEWEAYATSGPNSPSDWRLFSLAHECAENVADFEAQDEGYDCACIQYATDHHPVRSSDGA